MGVRRHINNCGAETSTGGGGNWSNPYTGTIAVVAVELHGSDDQCGRHRHGGHDDRHRRTTTVNGTLQFSTVVAAL